MTNNTIYDLQLHYVYMQNFMMLNSICVFAIKKLAKYAKMCRLIIFFKLDSHL